MAVTVVAADDHPLFRAAVAGALAGHAELELVGQAQDGAQALELIERLRPAVAILDVRMPHLNGLDVVRRLVDAGSATRALMLSAEVDAATVTHALKLGAYGYLPKETNDRGLCVAALAVAGGRRVVAEELAAMLREAGATDDPDLAPREREMLTRLVTGATNAQIADALGVSPDTVKDYIARAAQRLGVSGRTALAVEAVRRGLA